MSLVICRVSFSKHWVPTRVRSIMHIWVHYFRVEIALDNRGGGDCNAGVETGSNVSTHGVIRNVQCCIINTDWDGGYAAKHCSIFEDELATLSCNFRSCDGCCNLANLCRTPTTNVTSTFITFFVKLVLCLINCIAICCTTGNGLHHYIDAHDVDDNSNNNNNNKWQKPLRASPCQPTAGLTFPPPQRKMINYILSRQAVVDFLDRITPANQ